MTVYKMGKILIWTWVLILALIACGCDQRKREEDYHAQWLKKLRDRTEIVCMPNGHAYYYIWGGMANGGPGFAPILNDDGTPKKCEVKP